MIKETYSVEAEYLWDGETHAVFRHPVSNKWFGIIMEVKKKNLHILGYEKSDESEDVINVKANPIFIEDLLAKSHHLSKYAIVIISNNVLAFFYRFLFLLEIN